MKLYWRYKKDGKWTWKPAHYEDVLAALREMEDEEK